VIKSFEDINTLCKIRSRIVKFVIAFLRRVCSVRCNEIGEAGHIFSQKSNKLHRFVAEKYKRYPEIG